MIPSSISVCKCSGPHSVKQTDVTVPANPTSSTAAGLPIPSPAESSTSSLAPSERDYSPPTSPYNHRSPSQSATSMDTAASTVPSEKQQQEQQEEEEEGLKQAPKQPQRSHTTPAQAPASELDDRPVMPRRSATYIVAPEPLSRDYPKPTEEATLEEMLARKPCKHSLGHYLRNPKESNIHHEPRTEAEFAERARKFEETKRELRMDRERLASLA
ncbi:hypothetical protein C7999DRAFT_16401 [Corynascus novoguineensis]|uniref:Uncharacterized protein n=1 Tax=Corynascus novoguineensis TaxID=1126955 RepID=A0AAN7CQI4_9PEZI|nr:hypothetical protein C7999DRAFT_16401 [Corynascus novoguineensis]